MTWLEHLSAIYHDIKVGWIIRNLHIGQTSLKVIEVDVSGLCRDPLSVLIRSYRILPSHILDGLI